VEDGIITSLSGMRQECLLVDNNTCGWNREIDDTKKKGRRRIRMNGNDDNKTVDDHFVLR